MTDPEAEVWVQIEVWVQKLSLKFQKLKLQSKELKPEHQSPKCWSQHPKSQSENPNAEELKEGSSHSSFLKRTAEASVK